MFNLAIKFLIFTALIIGCNACSIIDQYFGNNQSKDEESNSESEPIPINPQHS